MNTETWSLRPPALPVRAPLDAGFMPAYWWRRHFEQAARAHPLSRPAVITLLRRNMSGVRLTTHLFPWQSPFQAANFLALERLLKFALWQMGGCLVYIDAPQALVEAIARVYSNQGARRFDAHFIGEVVFDQGLQFEYRPADNHPQPRQSALQLGCNWRGCRIGFDLGGSDRKVAAVVDGELIFSEEVPWRPYFESDPNYHLSGLLDSLQRAREKLPRLDAVGGSAAGIYLDNRVRVASLFRGVSQADFNAHIRDMFIKLEQQWRTPFTVVNDGEVTALAGANLLGVGAVLGISMGTSQAAGFVPAQGGISNMLNELAFAPVDYNPGAACDEWSGDRGCGVNYFSQQAVSRLAEKAGFRLEADQPQAEQLKLVQKALAQGDQRAEHVFATIGVYLGYTLAGYRRHYQFDHLLLLGRVTSGRAAAIIRDHAFTVLAAITPEWADRLQIHFPDERGKRHGQAHTAAGLSAQ